LFNSHTWSIDFDRLSSHCPELVNSRAVEHEVGFSKSTNWGIVGNLTVNKKLITREFLTISWKINHLYGQPY